MDSNVNVSGQGGQIQNWGTESEEAVQTTQTQNKEAVQDITKDTLASISDAKAEKAAGLSALSTVDQPLLDEPAADASTAPMSAVGGNPWSSPSGFVAVLIALATVAAVLARNALLDNKAIVQGVKAEYEMGVEAGKMARDAKYAEAMADIAQGIGQIVAGAVGIGVAVGIAAQAAKNKNMDTPHKRAADDVDVQMQTRNQTQLEARQAERQKLQNELKDENQFPKGSTERADKKAELQQKNEEIAARERYATTTSSKEKADLEQELSVNDPDFKAMAEKRDGHLSSHDALVQQTIQNDKTFVQQVGQGLQSVVEGLGRMSGAPFKMIAAEYEMYHAIFQTAAQCFEKFISAFMNDMQSQQQMLDSCYQLEQKLSDENTRAMSSHA